MQFFFQALLFLLLVVNQSIASNNCGVSYCKECDTVNNKCIQCLSDSFVLSEQENLCISQFQCSDGSFYCPVSKGCFQCHESCSLCDTSAPDKCYSCSPGYYPQYLDTGYYECKKCLQNDCLRCDNFGNCLQCKFGYHLDSTQYTCDFCWVNDCLACPVNQQTCSICKPGFAPSFDNQRCLPLGLCGIQKFEDNSGQCQNCLEGCYHCTFGQCYICQPGYFLNSMQQCDQCNAQCSECSGPRETDCVRCALGLFLKDGLCSNQCDSDEFGNIDDRTCNKCPQNCAQCANSSICVVCQDQVNFILRNFMCEPRCVNSHYLQFQDNQKVNQWQSGLYLYLGNAPKKCEICDSKCEECIGNADTCTVCPLASKNKQFSCIESYNQCPPGYFDQMSNTYNKYYCLQCPYPCGDCQYNLSGSINCLSCIDGFVMDIKSKKCVFSYFQNPCPASQKSCPLGTQISGETCVVDSSCKEYALDIAINSIVCLKCSDGSILRQDNGLCVQACGVEQFELNQLQQYYSTSDRKVVDFKFISCVESCPAHRKGLITKDLQQTCHTTNSCPEQYQAVFDNLCLQIPCSAQQYMDYEALRLQTSIPTKFDSFCKPCHASCQSCSGPNQNHCLRCAPGFFKISNDSSNIECISSCPSGFTANSNFYEPTCLPCLTGCTKCDPEYVEINRQDTLKKDCLRSCEFDQTPIENVCMPIQDIQIGIDGPKLGEYFAYGQFLYPFLELMLSRDSQLSFIQGEFQNGKCELSVIHTSPDPLPVTWTTLQLEKSEDNYKRSYAVIHPNMTSPGKEYRLECQLIMLNQIGGKNETFIKSTTFSVANAPTGRLNVALGGFIENDQYIDINFDGYKIAGVTGIPLYYKLFTTITLQNNDTATFKSLEISSKVNSDLLPQGPYSSGAFIQQIKLPMIPIEQNVTVTLEIFNQNITFSQSVKLLVNATENLIEVYSQKIVEVSSLPTLSSKEIVLISLSVGSVMSQSVFNVHAKNRYSVEKMVSYLPSLNSTSNIDKCDESQDCLNNSTCKSNPFNFYDKCDCAGGFAGKRCQFSTDVFTQTKALFAEILDQVQLDLAYLLSPTDLDDSNGSNNKQHLKIGEIVLVLNMWSYFTEAFNTLDQNQKFLDMINHPIMNDAVLERESQYDLLDMADNLIEALRFNEADLAKSGKIKEHFESVKNLTLRATNNMIVTMFQDKNIDLNYTLNNLKIYLKNTVNDFFDFAENITRTATKDTDDFDVFYSNLAIPYRLSEFTYLKVIQWPLDSFEMTSNYHSSDQNIKLRNRLLAPTNISNITIDPQISYTLGLTNMIDLEFVYLNQKDNKIYNIDRMGSAINFTLPLQFSLIEVNLIQKQDHPLNVECLGYNQEKDQWTNQDVVTIEVSTFFVNCSAVGNQKLYVAGILDYKPSQICRECLNNQNRPNETNSSNIVPVDSDSDLEAQMVHVYVNIAILLIVSHLALAILKFFQQGAAENLNTHEMVNDVSQSNNSREMKYMDKSVGQLDESGIHEKQKPEENFENQPIGNDSDFQTLINYHPIYAGLQDLPFSTRGMRIFNMFMTISVKQAILVGLFVDRSQMNEQIQRSRANFLLFFATLFLSWIINYIPILIIKFSSMFTCLCLRDSKNIMNAVFRYLILLVSLIINIAVMTSLFPDMPDDDADKIWWFTLLLIFIDFLFDLAFIKASKNYKIYCAMFMIKAQNGLE